MIHMLFKFGAHILDFDVDGWGYVNHALRDPLYINELDSDNLFTKYNPSIDQMVDKICSYSAPV